MSSPDYRLAPEHPHPACVEDALAAWRWRASPCPPMDQVAAFVRKHAPGRVAAAGC